MNPANEASVPAIRLVTTVPPSCVPGRVDEYAFCLATHLANSVLATVTVLVESSPAGVPAFLANLDPRLAVRQTTSRPTFADLFREANRAVEGSIGIVCNGDVYFDADSGLERVREIEPGELWTLSRHDRSAAGWEVNARMARGGSHDAWIFRVPLPQFPADYFPGVLRCDGIVAQRAVEAGLRLLNPCRSLKLRHCHDERFRALDGVSVPPGYSGEPGYFRLGSRCYCAQPCALEHPRFVSRSSPWYRFMSAVGYRLLPAHRRLYQAFSGRSRRGVTRPAPGLRAAD